MLCPRDERDGAAGIAAFKTCRRPLKEMKEDGHDRPTASCESNPDTV